MSALASLRLRLRATGYAPIPCEGKKPPMREWQNAFNASAEEIELWDCTWHLAHNTGLLTRYTPTLDLDVLNEDAARAAEELVRERYEKAGHVLTRIGLPPKRAIPFRTEEPFGKIVVNLIAGNGSTEKIELLADGQQVVAFGIHPDTHAPYRWHGGEPGTIAHNALPYIREAEARALVEDIVALLERQHGYTRAPERPGKPRKDNGDGAEAGNGPADWQFLTDNIRAGRELHDSLRDLAAKLVASGMNAASAVNYLRALMDSATCPHDQRWRERRNEIPRLVDSAESKFAQPAQPAGAAQASGPLPGSSKDRATRLAKTHAVFEKWFGAEYDLDAASATMAAAAAEQLPGDPLWLLLVAGPGGAKTETVQALSGAGAHVTSTIASEGALLSASPRKSRARTATGGLLRKIGARGTLVIKDFTSILSANRDVRGCVLAAIREIYDGRWERNVGTDGGQTLTWTGRIVIVAAVTTAWDAAHGVVATMGDRFVLLRLQTNTGRRAAGKGAIRNTGGETTMRQELAAAVGDLIAHMDHTVYQLSNEEEDQLVKAADLVTLARSAVERDYRGEIEFAHDPEAPTRFAKQLVQLLRGAVSIGAVPAEAMRLALRCARDSIPPLRRDLLLDLAAHPNSRLTEIRKRLSKPRNTVRRGVDCLHALGTLACDETVETNSKGEERTVWRYRLADGFDRDTLQTVTN